MSTVVFDISVSLDGYVTASRQTPEEPMGHGGEVLHDWVFGADGRGAEILRRNGAGLGAVIAGRRTYDDSVPWWGADGPTGAARLPLFVVTHTAPNESPAEGVYHFVTEGIHDALARARQAAGERVVSVMGGADLARQFLAAGLIDEISLHVVPVIFGGGTRLFDGVPDEHTRLETLEVIDTPAAVHTRFRVR